MLQLVPLQEPAPLAIEDGHAAVGNDDEELPAENGEMAIAGDDGSPVDAGGDSAGDGGSDVVMPASMVPKCLEGQFRQAGPVGGMFLICS